jgi:RNA polymerase sigma-70 factor (ECF subfamily)
MMPVTSSNAPEAFDFRKALTAVIPHLRAFARGLCGRADYADDLVQEALLKAWAARDNFLPGTNMKAWTFVILRNAYLTEARRNRFRGDYDPDAAERLLSRPAPQDDRLELGDLRAAMMQISPERREALLLVGAGGFSYEEAAEIAHCPVGTMKSRVARARRQVEELLQGESGSRPHKSLEAASHVELLDDLAKVAGR